MSIFVRLFSDKLREREYKDARYNLGYLYKNLIRYKLEIRWMIDYERNTKIRYRYLDESTTRHSQN